MDWRERLEQLREARRKLNEEMGGGLTGKEEYNKGVRNAHRVVALLCIARAVARGGLCLLCRPPTVSSAAPTQAAV